MFDLEPQGTRTVPVSYQLGLIIEHQGYILEELVRLRVLKEYELALRLADHGHGPYVPTGATTDEE